MLKADVAASADLAFERPLPAPDLGRRFGSDLFAETLRALDIPYVALNPGASFRGLHDSLVNHLGNTRPQLLPCLHEEHAVAIAQGWAKVTGRAMAAALHSNVGLMHGTMAIFNAWCDRMPVVVLGATRRIEPPIRHTLYLAKRPRQGMSSRDSRIDPKSSWISAGLLGGPQNTLDRRRLFSCMIRRLRKRRQGA